MLSAELIVELHDRKTRAWHHAQGDAGTAPSAETSGEWLDLVAQQHHAPTSTSGILRTRPAIPGATGPNWQTSSAASTTNQRATTWPRNWIELCFRGLKRVACPIPHAPLHSESPGLIIDRLSILALKIYHTREEIERADAPRAIPSAIATGWHPRRAARRPRCMPRCALARDARNGTRRFKLYRQLEDVQRPTSQPGHLPQKSESSRANNSHHRNCPLT
jgi:hypothetical protein